MHTHTPTHTKKACSKAERVNLSIGENPFKALVQNLLNSRKINMLLSNFSVYRRNTKQDFVKCIYYARSNCKLKHLCPS